MEHAQPKDPANGLQYQKSLLGAVLSISCLLKIPGVVEGHRYFLNPSRSSAQETKVQEANIHHVKNFSFFIYLNKFFLIKWYNKELPVSLSPFLPICCSLWANFMTSCTRSWRICFSDLGRHVTCCCHGWATVCTLMLAVPRYGPIRCQKSSSCMPQMHSF